MMISHLLNLGDDETSQLLKATSMRDLRLSIGIMHTACLMLFYHLVVK